MDSGRSASAVDTPLTYVIWAVVILAIPSGGIYLSITWPHGPSWLKFEFYLWWEFLALFAHIVLSFWWYVEIFVRKKRIAPCLKDHSLLVVTLLLVLMIVFVVCAMIAAYAPNWNVSRLVDIWVPVHAALLVLGSLLVLAMNLTVVCGGTLRKPTCTGDHRRTYVFEYRISKESIWAIDIPTVAAFVALFSFTFFWWYLGKPRGLQQEHLRLFIAGAVAFQVIMANTAFLFVRLRHECDRWRRKKRLRVATSATADE